MRTLASRKIQGGRSVQSSLDDEENTFSNEDARWRTRDDNSGVEVKGNSDYQP